MAEEKKKKRPTVTSDKGVFKWPRLNEPDYGNAKFPKPDGAFSVKLIMSQADADAFLAKPQKSLEGKSLADAHAEAVAKGEAAFKELKVEQRKKLKAITVNPIYSTIHDEETEEPTGDVQFNFSMKYKVNEWKSGVKTGKKIARNLVIFDAKGNRMVKAPNIWGGTVGKVSFAISDYFIPATAAVGLSLNMDAVQVISLVSNGEKSAEGYGFEAEEGYEYTPEADAPTDEFADESNKAPAGDEPASDDADF